MLDWLIIGGGIHGTLLSRVLIQEKGVARHRLRVLDPNPTPLHRWRECTRATGMEFLRSPTVHHLAASPGSLRRFSQGPRGRGLGGFRGPFLTPALTLFDAHAHWVIRHFGLDELRLGGRAQGLHRNGKGGFCVETSQGALTARRVLLALGAGDRPLWPEWAQSLRRAGGRIHHLFDSGFRRSQLRDWEKAVVVGGGISALQTALVLARKRPGGIRVLCRHPLLKRDFDTDSAWLGPKRLRGFRRVEDPDRRRAMVEAARHRGSAPPYVLAALHEAVEKGEIDLVHTEVEAAFAGQSGVTLRDTRGRAFPADLVLLATGFDPGRPGGAWLDDAIDELGLSCASCGYPVVDATLGWSPGLYVTGPLAELEIGPVARNIHGARSAGDRLPTADGRPVSSRSRPRLSNPDVGSPYPPQEGNGKRA